MKPVVCLSDYERAARTRLPVDVWDFISGASGSGRALAANRAALDAVEVLPRVLRDVSGRKTGTQLLGRPAAMPLAVAPMAYQRLVHPDGEGATAAATAAADVPFIVPMLSSVDLDVVAKAGGPLWLQLYWLRDRSVTRELIDRAEAAGCSALVLTVDAPVLGRRHRDLRNGFALPDGVTAVHLNGRGPAVPSRSRAGASAVAEHTVLSFDPSLSWRDVEWLREYTDLPIVLKGVLHPADAVRAADLGVAAVVLSNHGGRQFDAAPAGLAVLPAVREAVDGRCRLLVDGGVRSGSDILTALALGADAVLVGRPILWGLAVEGTDGVATVLRLLQQELADAMALAGCTNVGEVRSLDTARGEGAW